MPENNNPGVVILTSAVLCGLIVLSGYMYDRWSKRRYAKLTQDVHDQTDELIGRTAKLFDDLSNPPTLP